MLMTRTLPSPLGPLRLVGNEAGLTHLLFPGQELAGDMEERDSPLLHQAALELGEYFARRRKCFTVSLQPIGTAFQRQVWSALLEIPYGQTVCYGDIAKKLGKPGGAQAVGQANSANLLPIFIPCHRVIASDGSLGGYSLGLEAKRVLLRLEGAAFK